MAANKIRKQIQMDQLPARTSDLLVVWHATHDLFSRGEVVKGVCANCEIVKTMLRIQATKTAISRMARPFSSDVTSKL